MVRLLVALVLSPLLLVVLIRSVLPPFPDPDSLLDKPYAAILSELGKPGDFDPNAKWPAALNPAKSVAWVKPWLFATWKLQIDYTRTPFSPQAHPDGASRCLESRWEWLSWVLPCDAVFVGLVKVS